MKCVCTLSFAATMTASNNAATLATDLVTLPRSEVQNLRSQVHILTEQLEALKKRLFGSRSEKTQALEGLTLFDDENDESQSTSADAETVIIPAHKRRKRGQAALAENLPRVERVHNLSDEEKTCKTCGTTMEEIGQDVSERAEIIPPKIYVEKLIRPKCVCRKCNNAPVAAPLPYVLPRNLAANGMFAYIVAAKFCDAIPFHRLEGILARYGVEYAKANMCNSIQQFYELYGEKILGCLESFITKSQLLHIDETTLQVLREKDRKNTAKSYVWTLLSGGDARAILYLYRAGRSAEFLKTVLNDYRGSVLTDGYSSYDKIFTELQIPHAACHAHARRNFVEALQIAKDSRAEKALQFYAELYGVEKMAREQKYCDEELLQLRQQKSKPLMRKFHDWLNLRRAKTYGTQSKLDNAVAYALNQWPKLVMFLGDPKIPLDNNPVENAIRPFVIGRKNWMFSGSPAGAEASCLFYSLVETARLNGHEPYWYLRHLFDKLPLAANDADIAQLMPYNLPPILGAR